MKHLLVAIVMQALAVTRSTKQPNFVFFLADDLGWANVGFNGSSLHRTPHIDTLANSGVRFTDGNAAASICSPTRASIMTGVSRSGYQDITASPENSLLR